MTGNNTAGNADPDLRTPANLAAEVHIRPKDAGAFEPCHCAGNIRDVSHTGLALRVEGLPGPVAEAIAEDYRVAEIRVTAGGIDIIGGCVWAHAELHGPWKLGVRYAPGSEGKAAALVALATRVYQRRPMIRAAAIATVLVVAVAGLAMWKIRAENAATADRVRVLESQLQTTTGARDAIRARLDAMEAEYQQAKKDDSTRSQDLATELAGELAKKEEALAALSGEYAATNRLVDELTETLSDLEYAEPEPTISQAMAHFRRGRELAEAGNTAQAISEYQEATRLDPALAEAHAEVGKLHDIAGNMEQALKAFEQYLNLRPDSPDAEVIRENIADIREELNF